MIGASSAREEGDERNRGAAWSRGGDSAAVPRSASGRLVLHHVLGGDAPRRGEDPGAPGGAAGLPGGRGGRLRGGGRWPVQGGPREGAAACGPDEHLGRPKSARGGLP